MTEIDFMNLNESLRKELSNLFLSPSTVREIMEDKYLIYRELRKYFDTLREWGIE